MFILIDRILVFFIFGLIILRLSTLRLQFSRILIIFIWIINIDPRLRSLKSFAGLQLARFSSAHLFWRIVEVILALDRIATLRLFNAFFFLSFLLIDFLIPVALVRLAQLSLFFVFDLIILCLFVDYILGVILFVYFWLLSIFAFLDPRLIILEMVRVLVRVTWIWLEYILLFLALANVLLHILLFILTHITLIFLRPPPILYLNLLTLVIWLLVRRLVVILFWMKHVWNLILLWFIVLRFVSLGTGISAVLFGPLALQLLVLIHLSTIEYL